MFGRQSENSSGIFRKKQIAARKRPPFVAGTIVVTLTSFIASCIAIAAFTSVPEVTRAPGEISPIGDFVQIEAQEVGTVLTVRAQEGDFVHSGAVLATLASPDLSRQVQSTEAELAGLNDQVDNHTFILKALDGSAATSPLAEASDAGLDYAKSTLRVLRAKQASDQDTINRLENEVRSQNVALKRLLERRGDKQSDVRDAEAMLERGLGTRAQLRAAKDALSDLDDQVHALELSISSDKKEIAALRAKKTQDQLVLQEKHVEELANAEQLRAVKEAEISALRQRQEALNVIAPRDGHIHSVGFPNAGEVIERGETLFELMPSGQPLVAVLRLPTRDIGHIAVGMDVKMRLETFDARTTLPLEGQVRSISPNRVFDRDLGEDYFRTIIDLDGTSSSNAAIESQLAAGMVLTAEIVTRERSMLAYVLKPIERSVSLAFNER